MTIRILPASLLFAALLGFALPTPVQAAKPGQAGNEEKRAERQAARVLVRFDKDHDGKIDATEAEAVRNLFTALAALDTDHDGKLSDAEIAAAKVPEGKGGNGTRKGGKKGKAANKAV